MAQAVTAIRQLLDRDDGQDLIEYGLLAALIAIVAMAGVRRSATRFPMCSGRKLAQPSDFIVLATVAGGTGLGPPSTCGRAACPTR